MIKCKNCSAENVDGASFCSSCGKALTEDTQTQAQAKSQTQTQAKTQNESQTETQAQAETETKTETHTGASEKFDFAEEIKNVNFETQDSTAEYDPKDIEDNKIIALFSYIGILFLIPLLARPDSKYAKFHTNQGIVLFILSSVVSVLKTLIVTFILKTILSPLPHGLYITMLRLASTVFNILSLGVGVLAIIGIINACSGKAKTLPLIGKFKLLK